MNAKQVLPRDVTRSMGCLIALLLSLAQAAAQGDPDSKGFSDPLTQAPPVQPQTVAAPPRFELSSRPEGRLSLPNLSSNAPSPSLTASTPSTSSTNAAVESTNHQPSFWSMMVDGTAAIFGVLSASFAVFVAVVAVGATIKGIRDYQHLKKSLTDEIRTKVSTEISGMLVNNAIATIQKQVDQKIKTSLKSALVIAEQQLKSETLKYAKSLSESEEFYDEVSKRVAALQQPKGETITESEFDGPKAV